MKRAKIGNFLFPSLGAAFAGVVSGIAVYILWAVKNYTNMDVIYTMGMINIILSYLFFRDKTLQGRYLMLTVIACLIVYLGFNMAGTKQKIDSASARALYSGYTIISQNEYPTCNFVMAKKDDAYYVFESGSLAYEIPDASYKVLAAMARGPRILVINGGLTGMADALSEVPGIKEIVCVEADPYIGVVLEKVYRESVKKKVDIKFISAMGHSLIGEAVKGQGQFDTIIVNPRMAGHFEGAVYNSKGFKAMLTAMLADKGQVIFGGNK
jgi:predicted membrane-bound spermidine synthase